MNEGNFGGFSYSHGIETAIEEGFVTDRSSLVTWLTTVLEGGACCSLRHETQYTRLFRS